MFRFSGAVIALGGWLALAPIAAVQQYAPVTTTSDGAAYAVDTMSIRPQAGLVYSWERVQLTHDRAVEGELFRHWHSAVQRRIDNCPARTFAIQSYSLYDVDGKVVKA